MTRTIEYTIKDCLGCLCVTEQGAKPGCLFRDYIDKCPCHNCIIKVMCKDMCPAFENFCDERLQ